MDGDHTYHTLNNLFEFAHNTWSPSSLCDSRPTDLTLAIESWKFHVHKDILEKSTDYFSAMFSSQMTECTKDVIELHLVCPEHFKILIEGFYTGKLELTNENVYNIVQLAKMLQVGPSLQSKYMNFIKYNLINLEHCLDLMYFCIALSWQELYCDVRRFCLGHFSELRHTSSFADLSLSELFDYLSDKYLVVEDEVHVVEAIHNWLSVNKKSVPFNSQEFDNFRTKVKKLVSSCVCLNDTLGALDIVTEAVFSDGSLPVDTFQFTLKKRPRQEDIFMFWALLPSTDDSDGLVDVVRFSLETGHSVKFDSMTDVVEKPGFQLGSAMCASGPYVYLSGGGPSFGKSNWIRQIWRFDVSKPFQRWEIIGGLTEFRRNHAMVILENKLYIFGGFGKYRTKNSHLHSLDLLTGDWNKLPSMPEHILNPLAAASDDKIFYICPNWNMYFFSTTTKIWSTVKLCERCPGKIPLESEPVALFPIKASISNCFSVALVTFSETHLRIPLLHIHNETMQLHSTEEDVASVPNSFAYAGSATVNGKVVVFLTYDTIFYFIVSEIKKAVIFEPDTKLFCNLPVHNLSRAQSIIALPHLPTTFTMSSVDF